MFSSLVNQTYVKSAFVYVLTGATGTFAFQAKTSGHINFSFNWIRWLLGTPLAIGSIRVLVIDVASTMAGLVTPARFEPTSMSDSAYTREQYLSNMCGYHSIWCTTSLRTQATGDSEEDSQVCECSDVGEG